MSIIIDINDMEHEMTHLSMDLLYKLKIWLFQNSLILAEIDNKS